MAFFNLVALNLEERHAMKSGKTWLVIFDFVDFFLP